MTRISVAETPLSPRLCADDGGQGGLPVLFVHSLGGSASHWSAQLEHLRGERRAVALDLRGHGCSGQPDDGDYSIKSMARDIGSLVDGLGVSRFVLVGHSMGGSVAIQYAGSNPERVAGLLLVDTSGDPDGIPEDQAQQFMAALQSEQYSAVIEEYLRGILTGSSPGVRDQVLQGMRETPRNAVTCVFKDLLVNNPLDSIRRYRDRGPVLAVFTPFNDTPFSLHNVPPGLPHVKVTGTGHWLQMDRPGEFNGIMDDFLVSVDQAEAARGG